MQLDALGPILGLLFEDRSSARGPEQIGPHSVNSGCYPTPQPMGSRARTQLTRIIVLAGAVALALQAGPESLLTNAALSSARRTFWYLAATVTTPESHFSAVTEWILTSPVIGSTLGTPFRFRFPG